MKKRIISSILILFSVVVFSFSVFLSIYDYKEMGTKQIGIPAVVNIENEPVDYSINYITKVTVRQENLILVFIVLCIPVFFAGYFWKNNK